MISALGQAAAGGSYWPMARSPGSSSEKKKPEVEDRWITGEKRIGGRYGLTEAEEQQVADLKQRDREVRQHEQAHSVVLGSYAAGVPVYYYQMGPDGRAYAVGGSVKVDMSGTGSASRDAAKAMKIRAAAAASGDMSSADMSVAMSAGKGLLFSAQA